jgi:diguanylate cyclase (GGDEF)-like protein
MSFDPTVVAAFASLMQRASVEVPDWYQKLLTPEHPAEVSPTQSGPRDLLSVADSRELRIIYRVAQETRAVLDLKELLKHIVGIIREVMGYYLVSVVLPVPDHPGDLRIGAHSGYAADISGMIIPLGEGITGWAFRQGEPLIVPDVSVDPRYIGLDPNVRSELAFPLISRGKVIGVLNAESASLNAFTEADVALMSAVGSQLASAMEVAQLHESVKQEAMHDPLTRVYNRRLLLQRIQEAIAHAGRHHEALTIVFLDVDQLKRVNDTHGHLAGDALLREVAAALSDAVRSEDVVARYGGDEFVVLLASTGRTAAVHVAERIREAIGRHRFMAGGQLLAIPGVSIGLASYPEDGEAPEALLHAADADLYQAKRTKAS